MDELDTRGYNCPIPVLRTRKALSNMGKGEMLSVKASDPASQIDMTHFCNITGNELVKTFISDDTYIYVIRKN